MKKVYFFVVGILSCKTNGMDMGQLYRSTSQQVKKEIQQEDQIQKVQQATENLRKIFFSSSIEDDALFQLYTNTVLESSLDRSDLLKQLIQKIDPLLKQGANINVRNVNGKTFLMLAIPGPSIKLIRYLLDHGADPNTQDGNGNTALMELFKDSQDISSGNILAKKVKMLIEYGADRTLKNRAGKTALDLARENNYKQSIIDLLSKKQKLG